MIAVLSSAKTMDFAGRWSAPSHTPPEYLKEAARLIRVLRPLPASGISKLMGVSGAIASLNADRFRRFSVPHTAENAKPAVLAYRGDVYKAMRSAEFTAEDLAFADKTLRIISGLYGVLRPLDLIQPYRLEMAVKLTGPSWKDLYAFWRECVTKAIRRDASGGGSAAGRVVVNLASQEYSSAFDAGRLGAPVLNVHFKQARKGKIEMVPILAKRARGLMAGYMVRKRLSRPEPLKAFDTDGYRFMPKLSGEADWVFVRS